MNEEHSKPEPGSPEQPAEATPAEAPRNEVASPEHASQDARRRLRQLLAIPDRERSDAVWDEIIGLEIQLAPGNRAPAPGAEGGHRPDSGRRQEQGQGRRQDQGRRQEAASGAKPSKRFPKKSKRGPRGPTSGR
jgi:hypothetical protein